jgi:CRISPR-associated protein Cas2
MKMLIAYDIAEPRRLQRVAKVLKDYGLRVQKSIFEVDVTTVRFAELLRRTEREIEPLEDGIKYYPLCKRCEEVWYHGGPGGGEIRIEGDWTIL